MIALVPLDTIDPDAVESLLDRAFGPDRHMRTAYKVRENMAPVAELSFAAIDADGTLAGTIQCWPIELACDDGQVFPITMVGPVAVEPAQQQGGIGRALMQHMLDAVPGCATPGCTSLMLVGDPEYYTRFFDFTTEKTGGWRLPGPFEARRLLARGACVPSCAGMLRARSLTPA